MNLTTRYVRKKAVKLTIVGMNFTGYGMSKLKAGTKVYIEKEPENLYDPRAIKVTDEKGIKIGYIANSSYTVSKGCKTASQIHNSFDGKKEIFIAWRIDNYVVAEIYLGGK